VVALAADIEEQMVQLLVEAAPAETQRRMEQELSGPVVNPDGRTDVVSSQGEVDDLLASLGF
jgi:chemotaxis protein CheZ